MTNSSTVHNALGLYECHITTGHISYLVSRINVLPPLLDQPVGK